MNLTQFFDFEMSNLNASQVQASKGNALIANSLRPIIEDYFMALAPSFTIVISCRCKKVFNLFMDVIQYLFHMIPIMNIQLVCVDHMNPKHIEGNRNYNLLLIDSFESFMDIDVIYYTAKYNLNEYYHIFLMQFDTEIDNDMQRIFQYCWHNQIINANIQIQNAQGELNMFTYFPFGPNSCNSTEPRHINQYVNDKWLRQPSFLPKIRNLYGCPLVGVARSMPFFAKELANNGSGILNFKGYEIDMLHEMADVLNFTLVIKTAQVDDRLMPKSGGSINMLEQRDAHFVFGYYRKRINSVYSDKYTSSMSHYQSVVVTVISYSAHKLKSLQVLSFAFAVSTWFAMAVCFALTVIVAKLAQLRNSRAISAFSIVASAIGTPISLRPQRLDTVFLFTSWLWASFVMRAIYTAILYHLFSHNIYQHMPATLAEAASDGYRSVMNSFTHSDAKGMPYFNSNTSQPNTVVIPYINELETLDYLLDSDDPKLFGVVAQEFIMAYIRANKASGRFYVIPEILVPQQVCFYLAKHSFLINRIDGIVLDFKAIGVIKLLMKRHTFKISGGGRKQQDKIIHHKDLYGIYLTCGSLSFVATIVFVLELLSLKFFWLKRLFVYLE